MLTILLRLKMIQTFSVYVVYSAALQYTMQSLKGGKKVMSALYRWNVISAII